MRPNSLQDIDKLYKIVEKNLVRGKIGLMNKQLQEKWRKAHDL